MKMIKERLVSKGFITTILGVAILIVAITKWITGSTIEEISLVAGYGLLFLRSKDSLIGIKE